MRNVWRILAFDIVFPLGDAAAFAMIGVILGWPQWWLWLCAVLWTWVVVSMAVNFSMLRRHGVSVGTDPHNPGVRVAAVALTVASLAAAMFITYTHWWVPERTGEGDVAAVVRLASEVAEATATFTPQDPLSAIQRVTASMSPDEADTFRRSFAPAVLDLAAHGVSGQAVIVSAGVEAISGTDATVSVILRVTRSAAGSAPEQSVQALRVASAKHQGQWQPVAATRIDLSSTASMRACHLTTARPALRPQLRRGCLAVHPG
jgi:hypothetical protein